MWKQHVSPKHWYLPRSPHGIENGRPTTQIHNLPHTIRVVKSKRMRRAGRVRSKERRNSCKSFDRKRSEESTGEIRRRLLKI